MTTTKKIELKISSLSPTPATTGKVASQIGIAPRRPAQPSISRSRLLNGENALAMNAASGRATKISAAESSRPSPGDLAEAAREHEQPEQGEERDLRDPREALVEGDHRWLRRHRAGAEDQRRDVDGEKARAVRRARHAVGERDRGDRRDRIEARVRQVEVAKAPARAEADRDAEGDPERELERRACRPCRRGRSPGPGSSR